MSNREMITSTTLCRLEEITEPLAETYKAAFAGAPWFEVSKCSDVNCEVGFCKQEVGSECPSCAQELVSAYDTQELSEIWRVMIENDNAVMELETEEGWPVRATIARPTTPKEVWQRKYADNIAMKKWLSQHLPSELVWIEDTFANRLSRPRGNLKDRGATLGKIALYYGGLPIYTRTIAPQIVAATLRDVSNCSVFVGTEGRESITEIVRVRRPELNSGLIVPDRRTLLAINAIRRRS